MDRRTNNLRRISHLRIGTVAALLVQYRTLSQPFFDNDWNRLLCHWIVKKQVVNILLVAFRSNYTSCRSNSSDSRISRRRHFKEAPGLIPRS